MHLGISKSKNSTSLYVLKSTYNNGFHSTKIVEKLGTVDQIRERTNQDPIEWARKYIDELNKAEKEEKREVTMKYSPKKQIEKGERRIFNGGYLFLQNIYYDLNIPALLKELGKKHHLAFNPDHVFSRLVYGKVLYPGFASGFTEMSKSLIEQPEFTEKNAVETLIMLSKEADYIQEKIYENMKELYGINTESVTYDSTICSFDYRPVSGTSRQTLPVVPIEILLDGNRLPVAYRLNIEHQEVLEDNPFTARLREEFADSRIVTAADAGISSAMHAADSMKNNLKNYYLTLSFQQFTDEQKKAALDPSGWMNTERSGRFDLEDLNMMNIDNHSGIYYKEIRTDSSEDAKRMILVFSVKALHVKMLQKEMNRMKVPADYLNTPAKQPGSVTEGVVGIITDLTDPASEIIARAAMRNSYHRTYRICLPENTGIGLTTKESIQALICVSFTALQIFAILRNQLNSNYPADALNEQLRQMNFMRIHSEGFIPLYTRTEITDSLHEFAGFRTDSEIIKSRQMKQILKSKKI